MARLSIVALLATDPLITEQYTLTMLDSMQSLLLLFYCMLLCTQAKPLKRYVPFLSGCALGLFSAVKFPVMTPVIALIGILYIWKSYRTHIAVLAYCLAIAAGYIAAYTPFFMFGHTFSDWIGLQRWMVSFYRHANLIPTWGSAAMNLFAGMYQDIFQRTWLTAPTWSPSWPILAGASVIYSYLAWTEKKGTPNTKRTLSAMVMALLLVFQITPFWTRYLVLVLPLIYILGITYISRTKQSIQHIIIFCLISINITSSVRVLFPTAEGTARITAYNIEHLFFQDLYEDLTKNSQSSLSRNDFWLLGMNAVYDAEIESMGVIMHAPVWDRWSNRQEFFLTLTYYTRRLGPFTEIHRIPLIKEDGRWKIQWQWDMFLDGLNRERKLVTTVTTAKRGAIIASDNKPVAQDTVSDMIWITKNATDPKKEQDLLQFLETLFDRKPAAVFIHQRLYGNALDFRPIPIGVPARPLTDIQRRLLTAYPGISLTPWPARTTQTSATFPIGTIKNTVFTECCSVLYATTNYDGISGMEQQYNDTLKGVHGGTLTLVDASGKTLRTILSQEKKDGKNVSP